MTLAKTIIVFAMLFFFLMPAGTAHSGEAYNKKIKALEEKQLKKHSSHIKRDGKILSLKMESGASLTFTNSDDCESYETCMYYTLIDYFKEVGFYLVVYQLYEGLGYFIIDDKFGGEYRSPPHLILSPDKKRFVSIPGGDHFYNDPNSMSISIWRIVGTILIKEFSHLRDKNGEYVFTSWKDNKTILINDITMTKTNICNVTPVNSYYYVKVAASLNLTDDGWKINNPLSKDTVIG